MKNYTKKAKVKFIAVAAGFVVVFSTAGGAAYAYTTPYSYVSLDVNPSIEYSVNILGRVIEANGVNEDGEAIINNVNVENKTIDEAIKDTVSEISDQGYIKEGETGGIVISASSGDEANSDELAAELKSDAEEVINEKDLQADVEALSVGKERVKEARELGVTPGKLNLVEKLQKSAANPDDISIDEWINKPVKDIMKEIKSNRKEQKAKPQQAVTNDNNDQGNDAESEVTNVQNTVEKSNEKINEYKSVKSTEKKNSDSVGGEKEEISNPSVERKNINDVSIQKSEKKSQGNEKVEKSKVGKNDENENKGNGKNK